MDGNQAASQGFTWDELQAGVDLSTGQTQVLRLLNLRFHVRLPINPEDARSRDDRFTLKGSGQGKSYEQTRTIKDDLIEGDEYVDLEFDGLIRNLRYRLEVDPGKGGKPYTVFEELACAELRLHGGGAR